MRKQMIRVFIILVTAGAAVTALGLTGAAASAASTPGALAFRTTFDTAFAGYVTGRRAEFRFRFVASTIEAQPCNPVAGNAADAMIALKSNIADEVAHITMACGTGKVTFGTETAGGTLFASTKLGNEVRVSIFRNVRTCRDEFTARNVTTNVTRKATVLTPCGVVYRHALVGAVLRTPSQVVLPATKVRLWVFRHTDVTNYLGTHGTVCGPWPSDKQLATSTGMIGGKVLMFPTSPSDNCHQFGVWLNAS